MGGLQVPASKLTQILSLNDAQVPQESQLLDGSNDPTGNATIILTTHGVQKLAERGMWFHVSESAINDKSNASTIQKALVLCQVFWMLLQCVVRVASGLPLTLLEIHTGVHVYCAFFMYLFCLKVCQPCEPLSLHLVHN